MVREKLLIMRFNCGDSSVLRDIYVLYKDELVGLAAALLYDKSSAEDAVHDVFAKLIARQKKLKITQNLRKYLISATANSARRKYHLNQKNSALSLDNDNLTEFEVDVSPDSEAIIGEQKKHLLKALLQLKYDQREVVLLRHFSDLRFKDIASVQGVSINTVFGRYRYGLDKLRSLLNGELI